MSSSLTHVRSGAIRARSQDERGSAARPSSVLRVALPRRAIGDRCFASRHRVSPLRAMGGDKQSSIDFESLKEKYSTITNAVPPVLTAATVPVIALSLLCKALTGSGLPGTLLGSIEGVSYLVFFAGAGSFIPRASTIIQARDFSTEAILKALNDKSTYADTEDMLGKNATERLNTFSAKLDKKDPVSLQMQDIEKARNAKAAETPEQRAMKEKLKKELAAKALGVGSSISKADMKEVEDKGEDRVTAVPVVETLKKCMTTENYDVDVTSFSDKDLSGKLNLSTPDIEKGEPQNNPGDKWREQYKKTD